MQRSINPEDICYSIESLRIVVEPMPNSCTYYVGSLSTGPVDLIDVIFALECIEEEGASLPFRVVSGEKHFGAEIAELMFPLVRALILAADVN